MKRLHIIVLFSVLVACASSLSAATWYVNSSATGSNTGTSAANAWRGASDIRWSSLAPGDVVYWSPGNGASYGTVTVSASGSSATVAGRIWFVGTGSGARGTQPILSGIRESGANYVAFVNFEINGTGTAVSMQGVTGWLFQDCYVHGGRQAFVFSRDQTNTRNIVRGCVVEDMLALSGGDIAEYQNDLGGDYNVIEYTAIGKGGDRVNIFGAYNVFRNNVLGPMTNADLQGGADPHIDDYQVFYRSSTPSKEQWDNKQLIEALFSYGNQSTNGHFNQMRDQDNLSGSLMKGIVCRFNIAHDIRRWGEIDFMEDLWYYNNTFVDLNRDAGWTIGQQGGVSTWINNSFTRTNDNAGSRNILLTQDGATMDSWNNHEYLSGELPGSQTENVDPQFTDESGDDFMPTSGSPLRGKQAPITYANGSGSGTTRLVVDQSNLLVDGWGIVEGDLIRIGGGAWVRITDVDYATHTVTLAASRSWSDNASVEVFGTEDAVGALAYRPGGYTLSGTISGSGSNYVVTPNNADLCRMVVFYEDGVPQAPDFDAPFQYTSGGGTVTAKLYARFASKTPVVSAAAGSGQPETIPVVPTDLQGTAQ